ncbi:sensor domain-containing diguanylate cyclase [Kosakonia cowanii]
MKKIKIKTLITLLSVGSVVLTAVMIMLFQFIVQKEYIEDTLSQNNLAYARKLADTTDRYLTIAQSELRWSATQIQEITDLRKLQHEANRLRLQSNFFNSIVVVNSERIVTATSPESLKLVGVKLSSDASLVAVTSKKPFISEPFISAAGNYVVFLSQPIFSQNKHYIGYIGGTIYLKKDSMLSDILKTHYHSEKSDIKIISNSGNVIFSRNANEIGARIPITNLISQKIKFGKGGFTGEQWSQSTTAYASLEKIDWNIIITGDSSAVRNIYVKTITKSIIFIFITIILIGSLMAFLGWRISAPLEALANIVRDSRAKNYTSNELDSVQVWYYEAYQLKDAVKEQVCAMLAEFNELTDKATKDPLTGLYNRRGFNKVAERFAPGEVLSVISVDIDHFKKVNDVFGHPAGDDVLKMMADILFQGCRKEDFVSRFGGEEFIILLPGISIKEAAETAERIRNMVSSAIFPHAGRITISAGVASIPDCGLSLDSLLHRADEALYEAKNEGRNIVFIASSLGLMRFYKE